MTSVWTNTGANFPYTRKYFSGFSIDNCFRCVEEERASAGLCEVYFNATLPITFLPIIYSFIMSYGMNFIYCKFIFSKPKNLKIVTVKTM